MAHPVRINLALQGGGAHGAFTWGVLDRLLEEPELEIASISGTSAGALNGAALKAGWLKGGRDGARENLDWLWGQVGAVNDPMLRPWTETLTPAAGMMAAMLDASPAYALADMASRNFSPYTLGALYRNPLEPIVKRLHYDQVCAPDGPELFICATNVRTGKIRVFEGREITGDVFMASACLPTYFQAVQIDDPATGQTEAYWDGGYTGNPALFPLFVQRLPDDIVVVNINPLYRQEVPKSAQEIQNRINEISFNSSLLRELRAIDFVNRLIDDGQIKQGSMKRVLMHMIADDPLMTQLSVATKLVPLPVVMTRLKLAGRQAAENFLDAHRSDLNTRSSVNMRQMFG